MYQINIYNLLKINFIWLVSYIIHYFCIWTPRSLLRRQVEVSGKMVFKKSYIGQSNFTELCACIPSTLSTLPVI